MDRWRTTTLGELCANGTGGIQTGPFGSQLHASDYLDKGVPVVMPTNIGDNRIEDADVARTSEEIANRLSKHKLRVGDIVYSRRGDVERRALVRSENENWLCGTGCLRVRLGPASEADPRFVAFWLGLPAIRAWVTQHAVGATMLNLNTGILSRVPMRLPGSRTQVAIAEVLGAFEDKIAANERALDAIDALVGGLVEQIAELVEISQLASHSKKSLVVTEFARDEVALYSLPAFDDGQMPQAVRGDTVKSSKFQITGPCVLFSKLNPRIPRIWDVVDVPAAVALASTEFVVLEPRGLSSSLLRAAVSSPRAGRELTNQVAGTSGSHQRIRPADLFVLRVPDVRQLSAVESAGITALGRATDDLRRQSAQLARTRDELLPLLMSGRMSVATAEREVSNVV